MNTALFTPDRMAAVTDEVNELSTFDEKKGNYRRLDSNQGHPAPQAGALTN